MRIAIVGSRGFKDLQKVKDLINQLPKNYVVISGGAAGVDITAEIAAKARGMATIIFIPKWYDLTHPNALIKTNTFGQKYDSRAGLRRNENIILTADEVYAFWDGKSNGTRDSINHARRLNKKLTVIY
jgi:hypothetical protein